MKLIQEELDLITTSVQYFKPPTLGKQFRISRSQNTRKNHISLNNLLIPYPIRFFKLHPFAPSIHNFIYLKKIYIYISQYVYVFPVKIKKYREIPGSSRWFPYEKATLNRRFRIERQGAENADGVFYNMPATTHLSPHACA